MADLVSNFIVGVSGKAGHGKDTVASIIQRQLAERSQNAVVIRFADALKDAYAMIFSLNREDLEKLEFKLKVNPITGTTHREELQFLGTEAYRNRVKNPDVWIQVLCARLKLYYQESMMPAIIPDVRFENEARFVVKNGVLLHVVRPGQPETVNGGHVSEAGFTTLPNLTIVNDGDMGKLEKNCQEATELILRKYGTYQLAVRDTKIMQFM